jgi:hypothetical protein
MRRYFSFLSEFAFVLGYSSSRTHNPGNSSKEAAIADHHYYALAASLTLWSQVARLHPKRIFRPMRLPVSYCNKRTLFCKS